MREQGDFKTADEYQKENERHEGKRQRKKIWEPESGLGWIYVCMLHLGEPVRSVLFRCEGIASTWARRYDPIENEVKSLESVPAFESMTALFALMLEGGQIGDGHRHEIARTTLNVVVAT